MGDRPVLTYQYQYLKYLIHRHYIEYSSQKQLATGLERKEEDLSKLNLQFKEYLQVTPNITKVITYDCMGKRDTKPTIITVTSADQSLAKYFEK